MWGRKEGRKERGCKGVAAERGGESLGDTTEVNKDFKRKGLSRGFEQGRREKEKKKKLVDGEPRG